MNDAELIDNINHKTGTDTASPTPHLYLVDGSAYIFRAYHRLPPLTNKHGEPVGAVYGYTTMMWKLITELLALDGDIHMAVILDKGSKSFRHNIYPEYKAHRPPPPEDLRPQFPMIFEATEAFSLPLIAQEGVEADDVIASYTRKALEKGWRVTIVSSDKDLMQLIDAPDASARVDLYDTMRNVRLDADHVRKKFGVDPAMLGEVLGLMGDSADNIPGVPGIGPKTAARLISEYGDITSVLQAAPTMKKSKMRENLINFADQARLSRQLVELRMDCPLSIDLPDMRLKATPREPLYKFLDHHGFRSLIAKLDGGKEHNPQDPNAIKATKSIDTSYLAKPINPDAYEQIDSMYALEKWVEEARLSGIVAVDTETDSLNAASANLIGVSLALAPGQACYIPVGHYSEGLLGITPTQLSLENVTQTLAPLFKDQSVLKIGQNLKYDMAVLQKYGLAITPFDDTMLMSFNQFSGEHGHGMDELSRIFLGHDPIKFSDIVGKGKNAISFAEVKVEEATRYAAEDADITLRLWLYLKSRMIERQANRIYEGVDRPLPPIIAAMECRGVVADRTELARLSQDFAEQISSLEEKIFDMSGEKFAIGSPKQLGEILFQKMGFKGGKKGKSGQYSTDVTVLERLASEGEPIAQTILEWRHLSKLKSTYTDALQTAINPETGRIHTSYSLVGAQTGRLSSTDPNLQNIPIRTEHGRKIRRAFVAAPGHKLLAADYSQIELRLTAHYANVKSLKEAFANGEDIHSRTAIELFGTDERENRARAKTINFAILYGISRWGLARRLEVDSADAQRMIDTYFDRFPGIRQYIGDTLQHVREKGYTETLFGRRTYFPRINSQKRVEREGSERAAINAPIQGTSADIIKRAMVRMGPAFRRAKLKNSHMLMQVHDELVFEIADEEIEKASTVIKTVMENAAAPVIEADIRFNVDIGIGDNWDEAH